RLRDAFGVDGPSDGDVARGESRDQGSRAAGRIAVHGHFLDGADEIVIWFVKIDARGVSGCTANRVEQRLIEIDGVTEAEAAGEQRQEQSEGRLDSHYRHAAARCATTRHCTNCTEYSPADPAPL